MLALQNGEKKSDWKRAVKDKIQNQIQERVEKEMENKTKLRTVREDKWERKEYIQHVTVICICGN